MIGLIHHEGVDVHREASRALANLMSSFDTHPDVIAAALPGLVVLAQSTDEECRRHAALAYRKLVPVRSM